MWNRKELKTKAKAAFKGNYWRSVLAGLIILLSTGALSGTAAGGEDTSGEASSVFAAMDPAALLALASVILSAMGIALVISIVLRIFLWNPLIVGSVSLFKKNETDQEKPLIGDAFGVLKGNYGHVGCVMLLKDVFTALWSLLFIVPGIIKTYEYMMIPYILSDNPDISRQEAFALSKKMMTGNKWNAFVLDLSFIGWDILVGCTGGVLGIFYVCPYVYQTRAELYLALKDNA